MSIYFKACIGGATPYNLGLLQHAGQLASLHGMPWILCGNFQISPQALADTMFPEAAGARILADLSPAGTFTDQNGSSIIDFFVVSEDLAQIADRRGGAAQKASGVASSEATKRPGLRPASAASGLGGSH